MGSGQSTSMPKKSEKGALPPGSSPYPTQQQAYPTQGAYPAQGTYPAQQQPMGGQYGVAPPSYSAQAPPQAYGSPQHGGQYGSAPPPYTQSNVAPPPPTAPPGGIYPGTSGIPRQAVYNPPMQQAPMPTNMMYPGTSGQPVGSVSHHGNTGTTVIVRDAFDSGARFNGGASASLPPPPPGVAPNAAQVASMQGHVVVAQQQQGTFWEGSGSGGGYSFW